MRSKITLFAITILGLILAVLLFPKVIDTVKNSKVSPELSCVDKNDCTSYNTTNCCGWKPINKKSLNNRKSIPQICAQVCLFNVDCKENKCILDYSELTNK